MSGTIRLNKALKELNISLERAVEYLLSRGVEIVPRPNTKLSNKEFELLSNGFEVDAEKKAISEEITKKKEISDLKKKEKTSEVIKTEFSKIKIEVVDNIASFDLKHKITEKKVASPLRDTSILPDETEKKEKEKVEPVKKSIETKYQKLSGLELTGDVIDLEKIKLLEKKKSSPEERLDLKKKRKRILKPIPVSNFPAQKDKNKVFQKEHTGSQKGKSFGGYQKEELSDEEVQKQIRETLDRLQNASKKNKGVKYRKEKRDLHREQIDDIKLKEKQESKILRVSEFVTIRDIATMMDIPVTEIISACMMLGMMVTVNQRLDTEVIKIVAEEFNYQVEFVDAEIEDGLLEIEDVKEDLEKRAPIITIMGHVDHGKTSLLDYIRESNVIAGEFGGITQHIGAYSVNIKTGEKITFLDTPGHEAFTAMRARGTQITDLVIIVISAEDSVMPQTKEAISHAQAANVPIIFAINKIDKPTANVDNVKQQLANMDVLVKDWGGKYQCEEISAKTGQGIDSLLDNIVLESDILELKANPNKPASGMILDASFDKGKGYISTLIVQSGTLNIGDYVLAGKHSGKVRAMFNERGENVTTAIPSSPVCILGLDGVPQGGDKFKVFENEKEAKQIALKRFQIYREQSIRAKKKLTLDEIGRRIALGQFKELNIVVKGDVDGSIQTLNDAFHKISTDEIQINILHKGVGAISESDVLLASASDAIIIGFNVRLEANAKPIAKREEVDIRMYSIIYDVINDIKDAMEGMLSPEIKEHILGNLEVREIYKISKIGNVAGCMVTQGKILKNSKIRIIRNDIIIHDGELASLKRFKEDVKEINKGYDCGLQVKNYNDIAINDIIESYTTVEFKKKF